MQLSVLLIDKSQRMRTILAAGLAGQQIKLLLADNLIHGVEISRTCPVPLAIINADLLENASVYLFEELVQQNNRLFLFATKGNFFDIPPQLRSIVYLYIQIPFDYSTLILTIVEFLHTPNPSTHLERISVVSEPPPNKHALDPLVVVGQSETPKVCATGPSPVIAPSKLGDAEEIRQQIHREFEKAYGPLMKIVLEKVRAKEVRLPSVPNILVDFDRLVKNPEFIIDDLVRLIEKDPTLAAKVLAMARNFFFQGQTSVSLHYAIVKLGVIRLKGIVHSVLLQQEFIVKEQELAECKVQFWKHSLATANAMRLFAQGIQPALSDTCYLVGLFHNVGMFFLIEVIDKLSRNISFRKLSLQEEIDLVVFYHQIFTKAILTNWAIPEAIVQAIFLDPNQSETALDQDILLAHHLLDLSTHCSQYLGYGSFSTNRYDVYHLSLLSSLGIDHENLSAILTNLGSIMESIDRSS